MKKIYVYLAIAVLLVLIINHSLSVIFGGNYQVVSEHFFGENTDYEYPVQVISVKGGVAVAGRVALHYFDEDGFLEWSRPLNAFGALCAGSEDQIALCEKNAGEFYILDRNGEVIHQSDKYGKVKQLKAFDNNSFGFSTERGIYVYSGSANKIYFVPSQPGDLIDYGYSDYNKKLAVITLDSQVNCYVNLLAVTGEITAGKIIKDGLVFEIYLDKNKISLIKDDGIFEYDYALEEISEGAVWSNNEEYGSVYSYSPSIDVLCAKADGKYMLWNAGKMLFMLEQPARKMLRVGNDILLEQDDVRVFNINGKKTKTLIDHDDVLDIVGVGNDTFAVVFVNKIAFYKRK